MFPFSATKEYGSISAQLDATGKRRYTEGQALRENYLIFSTAYDYFNLTADPPIDYYEMEAVYIYSRQRDGTYAFLQSINCSDYEEEFGSAVPRGMIGDDLLAIPSKNNTYIFERRGDMFEEAFSLGQSYDSFWVMGRNVIVQSEENDFFSMSLADCTQVSCPSISLISIAPED